MAWSSGGALARVGDCSWPSPGDCDGFYAFLGGEPRANLVDSRVIELPHLWVGSCSVLVRKWFVLHLLATDKCWSTQQGCSMSVSM